LKNFGIFTPVEGFDDDWNVTENMDENLGDYWENIPGPE
jgi:hypothetical protein